MRISQHYRLGKSQYELDFVDVDTDKDMRLFLDPYFLSKRTDSWSESAHDTVNKFFQTFIERVRDGELELARGMFAHLHEPNETCLGLSKSRPSGRGVGKVQASRIFNSLVRSKAIQTGLLEDLEDCRLFIPNIGKDKTSDMTTNIIRRHLIEYTQHQAKLWGIPLRPNTPSGFFWNPASLEWESDYEEMIVLGERKILLVPKAVVSYVNNYVFSRYHGSYVLDFLQHEHLRLGTKYVRRKKLKSGKMSEREPTKVDLKRHVAPATKGYVTKFSKQYVDVFKKFKEEASVREASLPQSAFTNAKAAPTIDQIRGQLASIAPGREQASQYHKCISGAISLLFYPDLICPQLEQEINDGRKRIDIQCDNAAKEGFFADVAMKHQLAAPMITCECKNYVHDVSNPELDQLIGRLSASQGKVGLMLCRAVENMELLVKRCGDARTKQHVLILPITDDDVREMLDHYATGMARPYEPVLRARTRQVLNA